ncbi:MAG: universal stress protein [Alphaproteobacteria bacterium]|nr:universal stress protein [Alphaproteobacteria bacterium]
MSLATILVHVDDTDRGDRCAVLAAALAETHDAHLTGLGVKPPMSMPGYAAYQMPAEVFEIYDQDQNRLIEAAKGVFERAVANAGRQARANWRQTTGDVATCLGRFGRLADLIVIGQEGPEGESAYYEEAPDRVVLEAGRPVLIAPHIGVSGTVGKRVMIAWNDSREAARAVSDALPFLKKAEHVDVLTINPEPAPEGEADIPGADIGRYLSEHGVSANVSRTVTDSASVHDTLLNHAADTKADLIVMGGYGHSRLREFVLGGVTRSILREMTAPVLMAH